MMPFKLPPKFFLLALSFVFVCSAGEAKHSKHNYAKPRPHKKELENRLRRWAQDPNAVLLSGAVDPNEPKHEAKKDPAQAKDDVRNFLDPNDANSASGDIAAFTDNIVYRKAFYCPPTLTEGFTTRYNNGPDKIGYFIATADQLDFAKVFPKVVISEEGDKIEFTIKYLNNTPPRSYVITRDEGDGEDYDHIIISQADPSTGAEIKKIYDNRMVLNIDGDVITALGTIIGGEHVSEVTDTSLAAQCPMK
jgi:hypothetical protein